MTVLFGKKLNALAGGSYLHICPGCDMTHIIHTETANPYTGAKWEFNRNPEAPTFSPSILIRYSHPKGHTNENPAPIGWQGEYVNTICHYFIRNGMIEYCSDSTHEFAGRTVELPDYNDGI